MPVGVIMVTPIMTTVTKTTTVAEVAVGSVGGAVAVTTAINPTPQKENLMVSAIIVGVMGIERVHALGLVKYVGILVTT